MNTEPENPTETETETESFIDIRISVETDLTGHPTLGIGEVSETSLDAATLERIAEELDPNVAFAAIFGGLSTFLDIPEDVQPSEDIASDV